MDVTHPEIEADAPAMQAPQQPQQPAPLPPAADARLERRRAAQARAETAASDPEEYALYRREQLLAPYRRAVSVTQSQVDRFGLLERLRDPAGYERLRSRLDFARSAHQKAETFVDERFEDLLQEARTRLAPATKTAAQPSPAAAVIELDPRHQRADQELGQ